MNDNIKSILYGLVVTSVIALVVGALLFIGPAALVITAVVIAIIMLSWLFGEILRSWEYTIEFYSLNEADMKALFGGSLYGTRIGEEYRKTKNLKGEVKYQNRALWSDLTGSWKNEVEQDVFNKISDYKRKQKFEIDQKKVIG